MRVVLSICLVDAGSGLPLVLTFSSGIVAPTIMPFPERCGKILHVSEVALGQQSGLSMAVATADGRVSLWRTSGELHSMVDPKAGPVKAMAADSQFLYLAHQQTIGIHSLPAAGRPAALVTTIRLPETVAGVTHMLRPSVRSVPPASACPVGALYLCTNDLFAHVNIDTRKVTVEPLNDAPISQLVFGPFDNGPVMSTSAAGLITVWETGYCVRTASECECPGLLGLAVPPDRKKPRIWAVRVNGVGKLELVSYGLRSGHVVKAPNYCCI